MTMFLIARSEMATAPIQLVNVPLEHVTHTFACFQRSLNNFHVLLHSLFNTAVSLNIADVT